VIDAHRGTITAISSVVWPAQRRPNALVVTVYAALRSTFSWLGGSVWRIAHHTREGGDHAHTMSAATSFSVVYAPHVPFLRPVFFAVAFLLLRQLTTIPI
jgi:uncharacterized membrane protein